MKAVLVVSAVAVACLAAGGGYVAQRIREDALRVKRPPRPRYPMRVRSMSATEVRLDPGRAPVAPALTSLGLDWEGGAAELGPVIAAGRGPDVTRRVLRLEGTPAAPGTPARIVVTPWGGDPSTAHDLPFAEISYAVPGGRAGAWWVPGTSDTCAVIVHGRGADREEGLRILGPVAAAGLSSLLIRYRNDPGIEDDGVARFGQSEWEDLAAAVDEAAARGARSVVLVGISMGGAIVMAFLERARSPVPVVGAILDSPVLSLATTIDESTAKVIGPLARWVFVRLGRLITSWRVGIDWEAIDYLSRAEAHGIPTLLIHDRDDVLIPIATSDAFAVRCPDAVDYLVTRGAGHTLSWNADPAAYASAVCGLLSEL